MKCSSIKTIKVAFLRPHPVAGVCDLLLSDHLHQAASLLSTMTIVNRSNYSYHFLLSFQFSMSLFVGCLVCLFLVWTLFQPNKAAGMRHVGGPGLKSRPVATNNGSFSKRKCHSAVCFRPCLRPDDREVRLIIGKDNNNIPYLTITTLAWDQGPQWGKKEQKGVLHRYLRVINSWLIIIIFKLLALFPSSFLSLIVHQKWTNSTELSFWAEFSCSLNENLQRQFVSLRKISPIIEQ